MTFPHEVLAEPIGEVNYANKSRMRASRSVPEKSVRASECARTCERPILITRSAGRDPAVVPHLVRLAERLGMAARNQELRAAASARAEAAQHKKPLDKTWVARGLEQFRDANTVILHEIEPGHLPIRARQTRHLVR
jgi:hypothetical protein